MDKAEKRKKLIEEIVATEESYSESLDACIELYDTQLTDTNILSPQEKSSILSTMPVIAKFHQKFIADMHRCAATPSTPSGRPNSASAANRRVSFARGEIEPDFWGSLFLTFAPFLKMYVQYMNNHQTASDLVKSLRSKRSKFDAYCKLKEQEPLARGQNLYSFLIKPVQRIPRYSLLLKELLKYTDPTHPDYNSLQQAHDEIGIVASSINNAMKDHGHQNEIFALQEDFSHAIDLLSPGRKLIFVREGVKRGTRSDAKYTFMLFTDMLLYASGTRGKWKLHQAIPITATQSLSLLPGEKATSPIAQPKKASASSSSSSSSSHVEPGTSLQYEVQKLPTIAGEYIIHIRSPIKSFQIVFPSQEVQHDWAKDLSHVLSETRTKAKARQSYLETPQAFKTYTPTFDLGYIRRHQRKGTLIGLHQDFSHNMFFFILITVLYLVFPWFTIFG